MFNFVGSRVVPRGSAALARSVHNRNSVLHNAKLLHRRRRQTKHHLSQSKLMCVCEEMADLGAGDIVFFDESEAKILKGSRC